MSPAAIVPEADATAEPLEKPKYGTAQVISDLFIPLATSERVRKQSTNSLRV